VLYWGWQMFQRKTSNDFQYLLTRIDTLEKKLDIIENKLIEIYDLINNSSTDSIKNKIQQWIKLNENLIK